MKNDNEIRESHTFGMMSHANYRGSIEASVVDGVLHGKILFIRDMISYEADTLGALKDAFIEAVDEYLADCADLGKRPNKPFFGTLNVSIEKDGDGYFAQAIEIDYAGCGMTIEEAKKNFLEGLILTLQKDGAVRWLEIK
jgi:predicted HicB family RNase H-like nuclease